MASVAQAYQLARPWTEQLLSSMRWPPFVLGGLAAALMLLAFWAFEYFTGRLALASGPAAIPERAEDIRVAIPLLLLIAYLPSAYVYAAQRSRDTWRELAPRLRCSARERDELLANAGHYDRRALRRVGLLGIVAAAIIQSLVDLDIRDSFYVPGLHFEALLHRLCVLGIGWWSMRFVLAMRVESRRLSEAGGELLGLDLLDENAALPLARHGVRSALLAAVLLSLLAAISMDVEAAPGLWAVLLVLVPLTALLAGSLLLMPMRGVRESVRAGKRAELDWCNAEIRRGREALGRGGGADASLADLIAYKEHIASLREWPIDISTAARFGLALALPIGSWLGGALVERVVDTILE